MRILLISVPAVRIRYNMSGVYPMPPLGLAYIASVLEKHKFHVRILDMPALRISLEDLSTYLREEDFKIYGLSCNIFNLKNGIRISRIIKRLNSGARVILGGPCTVFPLETIFKYGSDFDVIVKGEGEKTMLNLCTRWRNDESIDDVPGISYRARARVITNPGRDYLDLDKLPFPARRLLPNRYYRMHPPFDIYPPITLMETSRGCEYHCTFCTLSQPVRERSVTNIIEEIREAIAAFKVREIHFVDPNFTFNQERTMRLCERLIKDGIKVAWTCKTRVNLVSRELLEMMSKAGCYMISYGVESGAQKILNNLRKGTTVEQIERTIRLTREAGIRSIAYLMVGNPGETEETIQTTIRLMRKIEPDFISYARLIPAPGSELYQRAVAKGILGEESYNKVLFSEKPCEWPLYATPEFSRMEINKWVKRANKEFYFRPKYWLRRLKNIKNISDIKNMAEGLSLLILDMILSRRNVVR